MPRWPSDILTNKVSLAMASIFAAPSLAVFFAIHHITGDVLAGAVPGFILHFVIFAFSGRISAFLHARMN